MAPNVTEEISSEVATREISQDSKMELTLNLIRIAVAVIGLLANSTLLCVFRSSTTFHIPSNHFVVSLAVNDIISLVYDLIFIVIHYINPNLNATLPCLVTNISINFVAINMSQLAAIALERFLFIKKPLNYYQLITKWKNYIIIGSWCGPCILFTPLILILQCQEVQPNLFMAVFASYLCVGFVFIASLYFIVFRTAHCQMKTIMTTYPHVQNSHELGHNVKLLRGYLLIVGSTFITYALPITLFYAYIINHDLLPTLMKVRQFAAVLATLNNSINPFVYFFCQKTFKDAVTKFIQGLKWRRETKFNNSVLMSQPPTIQQVPDNVDQTAC